MAPWSENNQSKSQRRISTPGLAKPNEGASPNCLQIPTKFFRVPKQNNVFESSQLLLITELLFLAHII